MTLRERAVALDIWLHSDVAFGPESETATRMNEIRQLLIDICRKLET